MKSATYAASTPATVQALGYAAVSPQSASSSFSLRRREPLPSDVQLEILYCGVCHSALHTVRNEWQNTVYPCVPGHEIVGRVTNVGAEVKKFKQGDLVAVGCMVDSCRTCPSCKQGLEQYCEVGFTGTYNSEDKHLGGMTYGGYSNRIVVDEHFVLHIPDKQNLAGVAPLLKRDETLTLVGAPPEPPAVQAFSLVFKRRSFAGSLIGGIAETQEMLDFCAKHSLTADVEMIPIQQINQAYERMLKSDVKYRFVIDMASLAK